MQGLLCPLHACLKKDFCSSWGQMWDLLWDIWEDSGLGPENPDEKVYSISVARPSRNIQVLLTPRPSRQDSNRVSVLHTCLLAFTLTISHDESQSSLLRVSPALTLDAYWNQSPSRSPLQAPCLPGAFLLPVNSQIPREGQGCFAVSGSFCVRSYVGKCECALLVPQPCLAHTQP